MLRKVLSISIISGIACFMMKCKKDTLESPCDLPASFTSTFKVSGKQYKMPSFNPENENEIAYSLVDWDNGFKKLIKFNLITTDSETILFGHGLASKPKWNNNDWIVFCSDVDAKIRSIKSTGDSLNLIYNSQYAAYADWLPDNRTYWRHSYTFGSPYFLLSKAMGGVTVDTLYEGPVGRVETSSEYTIYVEYFDNNQTTIGVSSADTVHFTKIILPDLHILDFSVSSDQQRIYLATNKNGLLTYDIQTKAIQVLKPHCRRITYHSISCSRGGTKLIGERVLTTPEYKNGRFTGVYIQQSEIYLIDLATGIEQKVSVG